MCAVRARAGLLRRARWARSHYAAAMIRLLLRTVVFLGSAALGILAAVALVDGVAITGVGFVVSVVVFAVIQTILSPLILKITARNAPAFVGGIGLISTFVALWVAATFTSGLTISGAKTWILATLVVWLVTALGTFLLPFLLLKKKAGESDSRGTKSTPGATPLG